MLSVVLISLSLAACSAPPAGHEVIQLTEENAGRSISISAGERFEYTTRAGGNSPNTYTLTVENEDVVRQVNRYAEDPPEECDDCPALVHWVFEAVNPGTTRVAVNLRTMQGAVRPVATFNIVVR